MGWCGLCVCWAHGWAMQKLAELIGQQTCMCTKNHILHRLHVGVTRQTQWIDVCGSNATCCYHCWSDFRSTINRKHSHVHVLTIHHWFVRVCITSVVSKFTFLIQSFLLFYKVSALITLCICLNFYGNLYIYLFCWTTVMCAFVLLTVTGRSSTKTVLLNSTTSRNWKWPADVSTIVMFLSATVNDKLLPI